MKNERNVIMKIADGKSSSGSTPTTGGSWPRKGGSASRTAPIESIAGSGAQFRVAMKRPTMPVKMNPMLADCSTPSRKPASSRPG